MKTLVAYFSATGTTEYPANIIAELLKSDIFEIVPAELYTADDLNWNNQKSRSSVEMKEGIRPALDHNLISIAEYDLIFLGFPIWWYTAPTIINAFLESYDFSDKTIIPFATSGGTGIEKAAKDLKKSAPEADIKTGKLLNNTSKASIARWLSEIHLAYLPSNTKFETMSDDEKKHDLFFRQKATLDTFLERKAISKEDYDKSLSQLKEKMGIEQ